MSGLARAVSQAAQEATANSAPPHRQGVAGRLTRSVSVPETLSGGVPPGFWAGSLLVGLWGLFTANPYLTAGAALVAPLMAWLLWRPGEPPVLLFACGMQWLQVAVPIFHANSERLALRYGVGGAQLEQAAWLSLLGLLALAAGMRLARLGGRPPARGSAAREVVAASPRQLFVVYCVGFVISAGAANVAFVFGGLTQLILSVASLKWAAFFMLTFVTLERKKGYYLLAVAVMMEFGSGFLGYFSTWKSVAYVFVVALLTTSSRLSWPRRLMTLGFATVVFVVALVWINVRGSYREFLNQGTGQQVVLVSVPERIRELGRLTSQLSAEEYFSGLDQLALRLGYVEFFAKVIQYVPEQVPHEHGTLWLRAVTSPFMPRLFFPDKAILDDSAITEKYTGEKTPGRAEGASIGIGYMAESYVDFGMVGMFVPILLTGLLYGLIYRWFVFGGRSRLIGYTLATAALVFSAQYYEMSCTRLVAAAVVLWLVYAVLRHYLELPVVRWLHLTIRDDSALGNADKRRSGEVAGLPPPRPRGREVNR